jgi:putative tryptophan/tyrosine transport system substrate-binding protein
MTISRRQFMVGAGASSAVLLVGCGRLPWQGQAPPKMVRIGFLGAGQPEGRAFVIEPFLQGLRELGYLDGHNIRIEYRFSEDRDDRLPALAAELVTLAVDLIVVSGTPAVFAAAQATNTIPIVMVNVAANPVETGLIQSLARPGGNITGTTNMTTQLSQKRLQLLTEIVPGLARVAVFWHPPNPTFGPVLRELEAAAQTLGLDLQRLEVLAPEGFEDAFQAATRGRVGALVVPPDPLTSNWLSVVADLALQYRLPTLFERREFVEAGGLMSYGARLVDLYGRSATLVDKILKGASPADLPVEQPMIFDFVVNLKTARALGIPFSNEILLQVTEVIP